MNFNQSALAHWPEDEAHLSAALALEIFEEQGRDDYHQWLIRERRVIANVFDGDQALVNRFMAEFNALTAPTTNLYF
jgi:hypothetical protein